MSNYATLTTAQAEHHLARYRAAHGRTWKAQLRRAWETGVYEAHDQATDLQRVRNRFGPSFLVRVRLPLPLKEN